VSSISRRSQGPALHPDAQLYGAACAVIGVAAFVFVIGAHLALLLTGSHVTLTWNPIKLGFELHDHQARWPKYSTEIAAAIVVLAAALAGAGWSWWWRQDGHIDRAARYMGHGRTIAPLTFKEAKAKAQGFGLKTPGLPVARTVAGSVQLYSDFEACTAMIAGPRTGKTAGFGIPLILNAPGPVLATSNKRDLVDATRDLRDPRGRAAATGRTWVFDPQGIAGEPVTWWWNPLSYVRSERHALELADVFATASRPVGAKPDGFFDPAGEMLVALLLMGAALARKSLSQVFLWLSAQTDSEAVKILEKHGYELFAADLHSKIHAADKERSGVFSSAMNFCSFMLNREAMDWVTPPSEWARTTPDSSAADVREFNPYDFVQSDKEGHGQTLYSLSKEGKGGAGPLVTALTMAVCEAAEDVAKRNPRGRLRVPLVAVLDEAANVCRWGALPDLYSHYGSRGVCLHTILQSWPQGVEVWGKEGLSKLWNAANLRIYGGGSADPEFLESLTKIIGDFDLLTRTASSGGKMGSSRQLSSRREKILDVADLAAMPRGRLIVIPSLGKPALAKPQPWFQVRGRRIARLIDRKRWIAAKAIGASIARHDPSKDERRDLHVPNPARRAAT
jgi:type IV secretory pathway TraG/TraD family ATPase VirD4